MPGAVRRKIIIGGFLAVLLLGGALVALRSPLSHRAPGTLDGTAVAAECRGSDGERLACWSQALERTLKENGLGAAFTLLADLSATEPLFGKSCHDFAHRLGIAAYDIFAKRSDLEFNLTAKTMYCSFGFYHGFMETLVAKTGDFKKASEFCAYVDAKLSDQAPNALLACYHGIGHGFTEMQGEHAWQDAHAIISRALEQCEDTTAGNRHYLFLCATGVFDSVAIAYYNNLYGLTMKKDDPLRICYGQPEVYKAPCYKEMMTAIIWLGNYTLAESAPYVEKFVEQPYAPLSIQALADSSIRWVLAQKGEPAESLSVCRSLRPDLRLPCVRGLAEGFLQFGPPEKEHEGALAFCRSPFLSPEETGVCFQGVLFYAVQKYPREKVREICGTVEPQYREFCRQA